ncbi:hypothetical protein L6R53_16440 [Myxococcota bacterium]|nr:hypothetical protein [Myxococcota bacterium]
MLLLALLACADPPPPPAGEVIFVRDGVVVPHLPVRARPLPGGRALLPLAWTPGQQVDLDGAPGIAPAQAECVTLWQAPLGEVARLVAMQGVPDTALAFSPGDGARLAVGTVQGEVLLLDGWTGEQLARRRLPEALVRAVAWSPDGALLYVAEQSPDATLRAVDAGTLADRWTLRLADVVGTSTPPPGEDLYGVYSLPAGYGLAVLPGGDLLVAATHGWGDEQGQRRNQGQVLRVGPDGQVAARWPAQPAEVTLLHPVADAAGQRVAVAVGHSSSRPAPPDLPVGGVQVLSLPDLVPVGAARAEPLEPWFTEARVWEALALSAAADTLLMGLNDGRVQLWSLSGDLRAEVTGGAPVMAGEVPLHVGIGWAALRDERAFYATSTTRIPWGAAAPDLRPPTTHPDQDTLVAVGLDGARAWAWSGEHELQGLSLSPDGDELVVGAGARSADERRDLYGALVFDARAGADGAPDHRSPLRAFCATEGPVFFRHAITADGRVAVAEYPYADADGVQHGAYRVSVLR